MLKYTDLGLVNTKELFERAMKDKYAVPAFNFNNLEQLQAVIRAVTEARSPVILQVSKGARNYANGTLLKHLARGAVEYSAEISGGNPVPIALHLDHGDSIETVKDCVESGFSSVMIDASHHSFEENMAISKEVADYAHANGVTVEAELGVLAGIEDDVQHEVSHYTDPEEVEEFVKKTGVDSLAISIGTSHGAYKFDLKPGETVPPLRFDILEECERRLPGFPIVLHGASSVLPKYVDLINQKGGKMENTSGVLEEQLRQAAASAVCKINIDSDGRLAFTARVREVLYDDPAEFDPRKYLGPARDEMYKTYKDKIERVFGSNNRY